MGVPKTAVMPAAAPATSKVLRSPTQVKQLREQRAEGTAGHNDRAFAPNGPPVPIEMADDSGFNRATWQRSGFGR